MSEQVLEGLEAEAAVVRRGVMRLGRRLRAERPSESVSLTKLSILGHLQSRGAATPTELAALERTRLQSLTRVLAELEDEGLVNREMDQADRRRSVVSITPAGQEALVRDMRQRDAWLSSAMAVALTPTERELLRLAAVLMDRLADR
jgi:DNA-binding MarR family transcriptional regulator